MQKKVQKKTYLKRGLETKNRLMKWPTDLKISPAKRHEDIYIYANEINYLSFSSKQPAENK